MKKNKIKRIEYVILAVRKNCQINSRIIEAYIKQFKTQGLSEFH